MTGFIISILAALATTLWGVSSCRIAYIDFYSDRGDFGSWYLDPTPNGNTMHYRVGIGLFTWLVPYDVTTTTATTNNSTSSSWSHGSCAGYTQMQLQHFDDKFFEAGRLFSVLAVLGGAGCMIWSWFLCCISLGRYQIYMMSMILGLVVLFVAMTFLLMASALCTGLRVDGGPHTHCTIDQDGLVLIASCLLWCVALIVSMMYIKPQDRDWIVRNGQLTNAFDERLEERRRRQKERQLQIQESQQERQQQHQIQQQRQQQQQLQQQQQQLQQQQEKQTAWTDTVEETKTTTRRGFFFGNKKQLPSSPTPPLALNYSIDEESMNDGTIEIQLSGESSRTASTSPTTSRNKQPSSSSSSSPSSPLSPSSEDVKSSGSAMGAEI